MVVAVGSVPIVRRRNECTFANRDDVCDAKGVEHVGVPGVCTALGK